MNERMFKRLNRDNQREEQLDIYATMDSQTH